MKNQTIKVKSVNNYFKKLDLVWLCKNCGGKAKGDAARPSFKNVDLVVIPLVCEGCSNEFTLQIYINP